MRVAASSAAAPRGTSAASIRIGAGASISIDRRSIPAAQPTAGVAGPPTPAVGWAAGIERLSMLIEAPAPMRIDAALVPLGAAAEEAATRVAAELRRAGIACEMAWRGNMKRRMQKADASGARYAVILGDDELARGEAAVKDLASGEQSAVPIAGLAAALNGR